MTMVCSELAELGPHRSWAEEAGAEPLWQGGQGEALVQGESCPTPSEKVCSPAGRGQESMSHLFSSCLRVPPLGSSVVQTPLGSQTTEERGAAISQWGAPEKGVKVSGRSEAQC